MIFDTDNEIIELCAEGMQLEGEGKPQEAFILFLKAWDNSTNNFEKFVSAHYVARHQASTAGKLHWDETALQLALSLEGEQAKSAFPSLYLNVGKGYEDLKQIEKAREFYQLALSSTTVLPDDGYNNMIRAGINNGLERIQKL